MNQSATTTTEAVACELAQPELFHPAEISGWGALGRREQRFAEALFSGLNQTQAAKSAGVRGSESNVRAAGARLAAKPSVRRVLGQLWHRSGADVSLIVRQAAAIAERSFREWEHGENSEGREKALTEWKTAAGILSAIHGRMTINVAGQIDHRHGGALVQIPPDALPALAQLRRNVLLARAESTGTGEPDAGARVTGGAAA